MTPYLLSCIPSPSWRGSTQKGREYGSKFFPFRVDPCFKGDKHFEIVSSPLSVAIPLSSTILWANSADKLVTFFLFFPENRIWHFMQIVSIGDNLHEMPNPVSLDNLLEMSNPVSWDNLNEMSIKSWFQGKIRKIFQNVICRNFYPEC